MGSPFQLPDLPGLQRLEGWPQAQASGLDAFQAGPDAFHAGLDAFQAGPDAFQAGLPAWQAGLHAGQAGLHAGQAGLHAGQAGGVALHALSLPADPGPWLAALAPHASEARRQRACRFHSPADALRCLAAEALLRHALWTGPGLDLDEQGLVTGPNGKPRLTGRTSLHFNLSHAGAWVLCALHDRPVGIDVEEERALVLPADLVMDPEELRRCAALPAPADRACFFRLWTLKESLLKALGTGLRVDPRRVRLDLEGPGGVKARFDGRTLAGWPLLELPMPAGVRAALCWRASILPMPAKPRP